MPRLFGHPERRRNVNGHNHGRRQEDDPLRQQAKTDLENAKRRLEIIAAQIRILRGK